LSFEKPNLAKPRYGRKTRSKTWDKGKEKLEPKGTWVERSALLAQKRYYEETPDKIKEVIEGPDGNC
jgi:hypothetical protein